MAYEIIFSKEAIVSINEVVDYLESAWSQKVANTFVAKLDQYIERIASGILEGKAASVNGVKSILITKHNKLYYEIIDDTLHLLRLWDTRQNPAHNPYE